MFLQTNDFGTSHVSQSQLLPVRSIEQLTLLILRNSQLKIKQLTKLIQIKIRFCHAFQAIVVECHILPGQPGQCPH